MVAVHLHISEHSHPTVQILAGLKYRRRRFWPHGEQKILNVVCTSGSCMVSKSTISTTLILQRCFRKPKLCSLTIKCGETGLHCAIVPQFVCNVYVPSTRGMAASQLVPSPEKVIAGPCQMLSRFLLNPASFIPCARVMSDRQPPLS